MNKILIYCIGFWSLSSFAQTPLAIPDTLAGPNYVLNMHRDSVQFFAGKKSNTYAFNKYHYLGPTLIFNKGTNINITVNNQIGDTTTVHWHGIHLPAKWDGGPHTPIMPSETWSPTFKVLDHAATYWYHPHLHMKTAEQAIKGAAGLIIVRDSTESALVLPRRYGIDDIPVIVQCQQYDQNNQAMPLGMQDSTILVNGAISNKGLEVYAECPAQVVRFRILNASGERVFNFGLTANKHFKIIGSDGGLLIAPVDASRIRLAPGERAEILVDLNGLQGQSIYLMSYASELPMGIQGGPTMPMPNGPPMNSPLNGIDFNIMKIKVVAQTTNPVTSIPSTLVTNSIYIATSNTTIRTIRFTADSFMVMDGPFYFNGASFDMERIDFLIPINAVEKWKLVNETMVAHPFHIHDVQFYLTERSSNLPIAEESGRKDVVLVPSEDSVVFITKFEDFSDTIIPYMFHCHILMHEDAGMMGQFKVVPPNYLSNKNGLTLIHNLQCYPNPSAGVVKFNFPTNGQFFDLRIIDLSGRVVYSKNGLSKSEIDISNLKNGTYNALILMNQKYYSTKIIKQ